MQFKFKASGTDIEQRLARCSLAAMSGSVAFILLIIVLAFSISVKTSWLPLVLACLIGYLAQFYFLAKIHRFKPKQRLHIWSWSLLGHALLLSSATYLTNDWSLTLIIFLPEIASAVMHLFGIQQALKVLRLN